MIFVKNEDLRVGMRLARPIYNRNGVLLFERDSKLTEQGIASISNFGLFGIFVLEPAEPAPPMSQDDIEFERFQTMYTFSIREEMNKILTTGKAQKMDVLVANILRCYGHMNHPINYIQSLRSHEDYVFKHSLNVAILCALMASKLNLSLSDQTEVVTAAVLHDIGKLTAPKTVTQKTELTKQDYDVINAAVGQGFRIIEDVYASMPNVKRTAFQAHRIAQDYKYNGKTDLKITTLSRILVVANAYDNMTSMQFGSEPKSEVEALRTLQENPDLYNKAIVKVLLQVINFMTPGTCVELNTGEKGLILAKNEDVLRPMILCFTDNKIIDLSNRAYNDMWIKDIMKTMDNRHIMDMDMLKKQGINL